MVCKGCLNSASIFVEGYIRGIVQLIFNVPMAAHEREETLWSGLVSGQTSDTVLGLVGDMLGFKVGAVPFNFEDLAEGRPVEVGIEQRRRSERPLFEPTMTAIETAAVLKIGVECAMRFANEFSSK